MNDPRHQAQLVELRREAERRVGRLMERARPNPAPENALALLHELQVHQIELEMQNQELRQAQEELEESRDQYRELYESIPVGCVTLDRDGWISDHNRTARALLNWDSHADANRNINAFVSDKDLDRFVLFCHRVVSRQEPDAGEFEMRRPDGQTWFAALQAAPVQTGKGKGALMRMAFRDITRRREAEETMRLQQRQLEANQIELHALTGKLFTAQEDERKRIARDLHDDHCQRVTTLILDVNMLKKQCEREAPALVQRLAAMSRKLSDILNDFRALSHELVPRDLGDTSLIVPIRTLIKEFSGKAGFEIGLVEHEVPAAIPPGTMTTIFRLLQECLCNVAKHANAQHVEITLAGADQGIKLLVVDDGVGFDTTRAWHGQQGMGIVGMRERVRLVGGTVNITSQTGQGTTMMFWIPLPG